MFSKGENDKDVFPDLNNTGIIYRPPSRTAQELREIEKVCARLFSSEDGQKVLAHLQDITFCRVLGASAQDGHLRYVEGQRALVATLLRLIDRGKHPL
ncbi:MAG: hypothetical protein ACRBDL_05265 [Alphaproteobacteria bacterium]